MEGIEEYIEKTKSAVQKLFQGVDSYLALLTAVRTPVFVCNYCDEDEYQRQLGEWMQANAKAIREKNKAQESYVEEIFAQSALCGAILQIAAMGIKRYSKNDSVPENLYEIPKISIAKRFCIGRNVRDLPLGLLIYAGRNQYAHFDEDSMRSPSREIFERIAQVGPSRWVKESYSDPAFDLGNQAVANFSSNITALIGWRSYKAYEHDMKEMLCEKRT